MPKFLVLSHTHSLLPFAYRLQTQGAEVQPVVTVAAFEAAWHGKMEPSPRDQKGRLDQDWLNKVAQIAHEDESIVITDDWKLQALFREWDSTRSRAHKPLRIYGVHQQQHTVVGGLTSGLRLGGWFDGEHLHGHHALVVDRGAWPGGMGPEIDGAMTMVRIDDPNTTNEFNRLATVWVEELKAANFRGLVQFGLNFQTEHGEPEIDGMSAGWPFLHTHAFLSELEDFSGLLTNGPGARAEEGTPLLPRKFVVVLPLSRPPWPTRKARFRFDLAPVEGLTPTQTGRVFWHDVQVDQEAGRLSTAGLDGLVGVVRGAADTSELALGRTLEVALRIHLPEKQFRSDCGRRVQLTLSELEGRYGVLL
jgi:hypothetical protein